MDKKINYGIDAPKVIRNLLMIGFLLLLASVLAIPRLNIAWLWMFYFTFLYTGIFCVAEGVLMLWYSKKGKYKHRDRMLQLYSFKGDELVLDVGVGSGLLMIGAAKRLSTGQAVGIDIWNTADLTNSSVTAVLQNARLEGVENKVQIFSKSIVNTEFDSNFFDVILSNLCLHNIYNNEERVEACKEIYRILKPGGKAIISDFRYTARYKECFTKLGMAVSKKGPFLFSTFPPLTIVVAEKVKA